MTVRALSLTTTAWRSFYEDQQAALERAGVEATTLEVPGDHRAFDGGVRRRSPLDYLRYYPQVLRESFGDYDLVHANYGLTAPFAAAQPRLPVVVSLWGGEFVHNTFEPVIRRSLARADAVVVPSEPMVGRLPSAVRDRAHVVPFPVDTERFRPRPRAAAREAVGWDTDAHVVLFPYAEGRYEKNYPLARRVVDGLPDDVELRSVANEPHERVADYLNASDALLLTSRWESGPMTAKEALACEVPVVSRPVGFVPDLLSGLDACHVGRTERELRRGLSRALGTDADPGGRERVARNTRARMGERLRAVYERCLDGD